MIELLKMCGFEADEAEAELPRIEKAFNKLGITAEDIERGKQRLTKYYDIELKGVRKLFRLFVLEVVNSVLAREDGKTKVLFGHMAPNFSIIGSVLVSKSREVFAAHLWWAALVVLGGIFDKLVPVMEAAERQWLKAGTVAHCGNGKGLVGLFALDMIPRPDLLVTAGFSCETAPKTIDLLHELYDIPLGYYDTCQDREMKEYSEASKRIIDLAAQSLRRFVERVQEVVGFEITDDMLQEALDANNRLKDAIGKLYKLIENSDPLPISATHHNLLLLLSSLTLSIDRLPDAVEAVNTLHEELLARVDKGLGAVGKGAPRILAVLPAHHGDPWMEHLAGELGLAIVAVDVGFSVPYDRSSKDPYVMLSLHLLESLATSLPNRIPLIIEGCKRLNIDGVLNRFHVGCRAITGDALLLKDAVTRELGIPVLLMEWENFDPRVYNYKQDRRRLELFKTMLAKRPT